ncbi:MAG TPA: hypothetical protein VEZ90_13080 [Blastocatellia bacterium]|nr:hypothetical protein [Blastocatellia bacterium]
MATRESDGKRVAIEHTIIEPFIGEKEDFAFFRKAFLGIEKDATLLVRGRWIQVFVPVGTLRDQIEQSRVAIVQFVHDWIRSNRLTLPDGISRHPCSVSAGPGERSLDITLSLKVTPLQGGPVAERGCLHVRRQEVRGSLGQVIERALKKKLPKQLNTVADKRILLLERQHMNLAPRRMLHEIDTRRSSFPGLARVDEIWFVETILYGTAFGGSWLRFELYEHGDVVTSFDFQGGRLMTKVENGVAEVIHDVRAMAP